MSSVSITKCESYEQSQVDQAINQSLQLLGGLQNVVKPGMRVLIKPNVLNGSAPELAVTTHPSIIAALIKAVKKLGGLPVVGDSPGFGTSEKALAGSGILKVIQEEGAELATFDQAKEIEFKGGVVYKKMRIAKDVLEADIVINVAKLKTHAYSGITAAVKNLFGCVSGLVKSQLHLQYPHKDEFDLMLFDILRLVKPTLNIVDAVVAMEGVGGPVTGNPRHMNLIIAGKDAVAVDAICAALTGKEPTDFNFLQLAQKRGFGEADLNKIEVVGENLAQRACHDFKHFLTFGDEMLPPMIPKVFVPYLRRILIDRPILNKRNCTKCGACLEVCAAKAITLEDGFPTFDYAKCIGCFCCQEMCEFSAIKIKKSLIARALFKLSSLIFSSKKW